MVQHHSYCHPHILTVDFMRQKRHVVTQVHAVRATKDNHMMKHSYSILTGESSDPSLPLVFAVH